MMIVEMTMVMEFWVSPSSDKRTSRDHSSRLETNHREHEYSEKRVLASQRRKHERERRLENSGLIPAQTSCLLSLSLDP